MSFNIHPLPQNQPPPRTGQAFLHRLHGSGWKDIWVASSGGWGGGRAGDILTSFPVSTGHYYSAAHIRKGATTRSNATFESLWAIVIDDVGTSTGSNLDLDEHRLLLPEPTAIIETSENNFQWLYALAAPEPDVAKISAAFAALKLHPLLGPGFKDTADLTHYFRLPGGVNPKPGKESFSTACRELDLANRHDFDQLMAAFGIDLPAAMAAAPLRAPASAPSEQVPVARIRAMFDALPNTFDRWAWLSMAHAVAAATQDEPAEARDAFVAWSATHVPKDGRTPAEVVREAERVWDTLGDDHKAGAGTLRKHLEQGASRYEDRIALDPGEGFTTEIDEARVSAVVEETTGSLPPDPKEIEDLILKLYAERPTPALYVQSDPGGRQAADPFKARNPTPPFPVYPILVPGYVRGYAMMLSGASGLGKSAFSVGLANAITHNAPHILGCGPINPKFLGDVVILSNEDGETEIDRRIYASRIHHGLGAPLHDYYITPGSGLIGKDASGRIVLTCATLLRRLIELRRQRDIAVIVIDTLASVVDGLEENSTDMQAAMRHFQRLAWAAWACVVVIHHPTKAAANDDAVKRTQASVRGSGSLTATIRSGATLSTPSAQEQEEFGFTAGQMDSIVVHEGFKNSWGAKAPRTFFNRVSVGVPLIDMDGVAVAGDAVVLEHYIPNPRSMQATFKVIQRTLLGASGPVRYDLAQARASQRDDALDKLTGLPLKVLKEAVGVLEANGKVRVRTIRINGNKVSVIEIVDWEEEGEGGDEGGD